MKTLGVVGLGLIGGSLVKAYERSEDWKIYGYDRDSRITQLALLAEDIEEELTRDNIGEVDLLLLALYPKATVDYLQEMGKYISKDTLVIDCCGVKRYVCDRLYPAFAGSQAVFMGGHPMAGRERSGFSFAQDDLFENASMILAPAPGTDVETIRRAKEIFLSVGFGRVRFTTPLEHDEMIAFTSQLAHVVSSAYVKTPLAPKHKGFSAGSFRNMTRVARLNETMWTELFLENDDLLLGETQNLIDRLTEYRDALRDRDGEKLKSLLRDGREIKEALED